MKKFVFIIVLFSSCMHRADSTRELDTRGIFQEIPLKQYHKNDVFMIEYYNSQERLEVKIGE